MTRAGGHQKTGGADACDTVHELYKPVLADHTVMYSLGRFDNSIAKAHISERLEEAMTCTNLVKVKLRLGQAGGYEDQWAHNRENL